MLDKRLVYVTGKGGVGKTTVAAALGLAAARAGKRTVIAEVAEQERISQTFGHAPAGFTETEVADGLCAFSIDPEEAKQEWLRHQLHSGALAGLLNSSRIFSVLTAAAPGLAEVVTMGKIWELAQLQRRAAKAAPYDLVIVDAPATGHGLALLRAPRTFADIARVGPVKNHAETIHSFTADPKVTAIVAVALAEEMPVNETIDLEERLAEGDGPEAVRRAGQRRAARALHEGRRRGDGLRRRRGQPGRAGGAHRRAAAPTSASAPSARRSRASSAGSKAPVATLPFLLDPRGGARGPRAPLPRAGAQAVKAPGVGELIARKEVVICAGSGGVGKTTVSAAIAAGAAAQGKTAAVLTIDPAKRLANSLGLPELGNEERRVEMDAPGELWAMMLDAKRTFDDLVGQLRARREDARRGAGQPDLPPALERRGGLPGVHGDGEAARAPPERATTTCSCSTPRPPATRSTSSTPRGGSRASSTRARSSFFRAAGGMSLGIFGRGTGMLFSVMKRATGVDLLKDLAEFFNSFGEMSDGFRDRAKKVDALIAHRCTTFLLVTSPRAAAIEEAQHFHRKLQAENLPFGGVIVNRMREPLTRRAAARRWRPSSPSCSTRSWRARWPATSRTTGRLAERDEANVERLAGQLGRKPVLTVPELSGDVHDLDGLAELNGHLFSADALRR